MKSGGCSTGCSLAWLGSSVQTNKNWNQTCVFPSSVAEEQQQFLLNTFGVKLFRPWTLTRTLCKMFLTFTFPNRYLHSYRHAIIDVLRPNDLTHFRERIIVYKEAPSQSAIFKLQQQIAPMRSPCEPSNAGEDQREGFFDTRRLP